MSLDTPARTARAVALLAQYARGRAVAFAPHAALELIERPVVMPVPGMPYYAHGLLRWQASVVPLIDLHTLLRAHADTALAPPRYALILAWQHAAGAPLAHGAIGLQARPQRMVVDAGSKACPLPNDSDLWPLIAISCLRKGEQVFPILDTSRLFGSAHG